MGPLFVFSKKSGCAFGKSAKLKNLLIPLRASQASHATCACAIPKLRADL
jgi:hypothetical protein